jgi:hypothetical protein
VEDQQDAVIAVVELLAEHGPQLDRPHADRITGSSYHKRASYVSREDS